MHGFSNGRPTLLVYCLFLMSQFNHKRTTSSVAPTTFFQLKDRRFPIALHFKRNEAVMSIGWKYFAIFTQCENRIWQHVLYRELWTTVCTNGFPQRLVLLRQQHLQQRRRRREHSLPTSLPTNGIPGCNYFYAKLLCQSWNSQNCLSFFCNFGPWNLETLKIYCAFRSRNH